MVDVPADVPVVVVIPEPHPGPTSDRRAYDAARDMQVRVENERLDNEVKQRNREARIVALMKAEELDRKDAEEQVDAEIKAEEDAEKEAIEEAKAAKEAAKEAALEAASGTE